MITAGTRLAGIIGDPVRHSLSPVLHNAAYAALGLDWVYLAFAVPDGATAHALDAARAFAAVGLSITMPHKAAATDACDVLSDDAARLHSVNTVTLVDGALHGDSTDGAGFVRALADAGVDPAGRTTLVLGAGGAARAVVLALARAGADIAVAARRLDPARAAADLASGAVVPWEARESAARAADLIVNATPVGMGDGDLPFPATVLGPDQVVADLVYHPLETPLLAAARAAGAVPIDGLGMLVHQAALQVERWSDRAAPVAVMRDAALATLARG